MLQKSKIKLTDSSVKKQIQSDIEAEAPVLPRIHPIGRENLSRIKGKYQPHIIKEQEIFKFLKTKHELNERETKTL